jgi:hypothetical protein
LADKAESGNLIDSPSATMITSISEEEASSAVDITSLIATMGVGITESTSAIDTPIAVYITSASYIDSLSPQDLCNFLSVHATPSTVYINGEARTVETMVGVFSYGFEITGKSNLESDLIGIVGGEYKNDSS